jgi:hypothetical protein
MQRSVLPRAYKLLFLKYICKEPSNELVEMSTSYEGKTNDVGKRMKLTAMCFIAVVSTVIRTVTKERKWNAVMVLTQISIRTRHLK